jgi:prepilin-type N-terminal cleavage/methylation domain-containing protein
MSKNISNQRGFTIIELLIATLVFSVVLLLCTAALMQISKVYYRGVISTRTQEVARTIVNDISEHLQFSSKDIYSPLPPSGSNQGFCVGSFLYSYVAGTDGELPADDTGRHALVVNDLGRPCTSSEVPQNVATGGVLAGREFLQPLMRVAYLNVTETPIGSGIYKINLTLAYGQDDLLEVSSGQNARCKSIQNSPFCAVVNLSGTVQRRVQ